MSDTVRESRDAWRSIAEDSIREAHQKLEAARVTIASKDATIARLTVERDEYATIVAYIVGAPERITNQERCIFTFASPEHRKDFDRLIGDALVGPIKGHPNATERAEAAEARIATLEGVLRKIKWCRATPYSMGFNGWALSLEDGDDLRALIATDQPQEDQPHE